MIGGHRVSVIIPCFNGARYMERLISALGSVTAPQLQIVFVDDGSTDGSLEMFRKLLPNAVSFGRQNRGLGATRNEAVRLAEGDFLQFLDVDDTIESRKIETQLAHAVAVGADIVYSDWRMVNVVGSRETPEPWVKAEMKSEIVEALLDGWWFPPHAALIRKSAFESVGGCDETLGNTCEDFDLWLRLAIAGCVYSYTPGNFSNYYRYHDVKSMSRKSSHEFFSGVEKILSKALNLMAHRAELTPRRRRAAARRLHSVARNVRRLDKNWYDRLMTTVYSLWPRFRPDGSVRYRVFAAVLGVRKADAIAASYRRMLLPLSAKISN